MTTLADALKDQAEKNILALQKPAPHTPATKPRTTKEEVKQFAMAAATFHPDTIKAVQLNSTYMDEFATLIGSPEQSFKLHTFVPVTAAATGVQAVWNQILWTWANSPDVADATTIDPGVQQQIDVLIPNYVALIAREFSPPPAPPPDEEEEEEPP
jgi:hypothetical protein